MANISQLLSTMTARQKITVGVFLVIAIFLLWQVIGLFGGDSTSPPPTTSIAANQPSMPTPQPAPLPKPTPVSPREAELIQLQQETEAKYIAALNQLQMLKIAKDIAETNQSIMSAKLATVTAQKNIIDLLKPPPPVPKAIYSQGLVNPSAGGSTSNANAPSEQLPEQEVEITYTVISVSRLQNKWNAVLGHQGKLYSVVIGDILPPDESKVITINQSGVILLDKNGTKKKLSLVPII